MRPATAALVTAWLAACGEGAVTPAPTSGVPVRAAPAAAGGWFRDVTAASGVDVRHEIADGTLDSLPESVGAGVAAADFDRDGRMDLFFTGQGWAEAVSRGEAPKRATRHRLFRNLGGARFEDVTDRAGFGDASFASMAVPIDFDGDGLDDLFVTGEGPDRLYRNRGDLTFEDVSRKAGVEDSRFGVAAAAFDADGDGDLDLYVGNYVAFVKENRLFYKPDVFPPPLAYRAEPDVLLVNRGDGTFRDATAGSGLDVTPGRAMGATVFDGDGDGRPDLFVANDASRNFLFRNLGGGKFSEEGVERGAAFGAMGDTAASMAAMAADVNEDGRTDLLVTTASYGSLLMGGTAGYVDRILQCGIAAASAQWPSWGGGLFDADGDGHIDLFVAHGDLHRSTGRPDLLFLGLGDGTFEDASERAGAWFRAERCGRAVCVVDVDDDARLDLVVTHVQDGVAILRNEAPQRGRSLLVSLRPKPGNASGQGARVTVEAGGRVRTQVAWPRGGYLAIGDPRIHFGLGDAATAERLEVVWPDGTKTEGRDLAADRVWTAEQGGGVR